MGSIHSLTEGLSWTQLWVRVGVGMEVGGWAVNFRAEFFVGAVILSVRTATFEFEGV
jgi:hypothetical protein